MDHGIRPTTRSPRGMTLLEMLFATVLLGVVAATAVPLLRSVALTATEPTPVLGMRELAFIVDAALEDPEVSGIDFKDGGPWSVPVPEEIGDGTIQLTMLADLGEGEAEGDLGLGGSWVRAEFNGLVLLRWIAYTPEEASDADGAQSGEVVE